MNSVLRLSVVVFNRRATNYIQYYNYYIYYNYYREITVATYRVASF